MISPQIVEDLPKKCTRKTTKQLSLTPGAIYKRGYRGNLREHLVETRKILIDQDRRRLFKPRRDWKDSLEGLAVEGNERMRVLGDQAIEQKGPRTELVSVLRALKLEVTDADDSVVVMQAATMFLKSLIAPRTSGSTSNVEETGQMALGTNVRDSDGRVNGEERDRQGLIGTTQTPNPSYLRDMGYTTTPLPWAPPQTGPIRSVGRTKVGQCSQNGDGNLSTRYSPYGVVERRSRKNGVEHGSGLQSNDSQSYGYGVVDSHSSYVAPHYHTSEAVVPYPSSMSSSSATSSYHAPHYTSGATEPHLSYGLLSPSSSSTSSYTEPHHSTYYQTGSTPVFSSIERAGVSSQMGVDTYSQQYPGYARKQTTLYQGSHPYSMNRVNWDPRITSGLPYEQHPSTIRGEENAGRMGERTNLDILGTVTYENGIFYVDEPSV